MSKKVIGVDIGGTKISVVLGSLAGEIFDKKVLKTKLFEETSDSIEEIKQVVDSYLDSDEVDRQDFAGIGICFAGPIGEDAGIILNPPNLPGWDGLNLGEIFTDYFKMNVVCNNDANAAALAEKRFGHGKSVKDFVYITISTGIGSGIIIDNKLLMGATNSAGEFGHVCVEPSSFTCGCSKSGCLEAMASGTAIAKAGQAILKKDVELLQKLHKESAYYFYKLEKSIENLDLLQLSTHSILSGQIVDDLDAKIIFEAAQEGDELATYLYWRAGFYFGLGLSNLIQVLDPQMITLGGSVVKSGDLYLKPMRSALDMFVWQSMLNQCQILNAKLGDQVADLGAIALVVDNI